MPRREIDLDVSIADLLAGIAATPKPDIEELLDANAQPVDTSLITAPVPDPLANVTYTGNVETDAKTELDALSTAFRAKNEIEKKRRQDATDSEYWVAVYFETRAEKHAFLEEFKIKEHGTKYLDGRKVAATLRRLMKRK